MSAPSENDKACKVAIFDSYSKTVMKNICRNVIDAKKRRQENEMLGTEKMQYLFDEQSIEDHYPSEHVLMGGDGHICVITTEWLYQAIIQLLEKQREVLILEYWYGMSRSEMGKLLNVSERTIYTWKQKAIKAIRKYYERNT